MSGANTPLSALAGKRGALTPVAFSTFEQFEEAAVEEAYVKKWTLKPPPVRAGPIHLKPAPLRQNFDLPSSLPEPAVAVVAAELPVVTAVTEKPADGPLAGVTRTRSVKFSQVACIPFAKKQ
jgi:hypothetical protein